MINTYFQLNTINKCFIFRIIVFITTLLSFDISTQAQTDYITLNEGAYIIDMGVTPQTIENGIKPYGLLYDLLNNYRVPIHWVIEPTKAKDGIDFSYAGNDFRGGPFIIPAEYLSPSIQAVITNWENEGVVGIVTSEKIVVPVYTTLSYSIRWTLDAQNGAIAKSYLTSADISETAYDWVTPADLTCCNDIFVMPHADPEWDTHGNLLNWNDDPNNGGCDGAIWAACHAVSVLENVINPLDPSVQMNFLMQEPLLIEGLYSSLFLNIEIILN